MKTRFVRLTASLFLIIVALILCGSTITAQTRRANGKIAFTSTRDGNMEIYVMNADGTNQVRLTSNPGVDDFPIWSPDGRRIAYVSQGVTGDFAIKLMNADGNTQTMLTPIAFFSQYPWHQHWSMSWSPDGTKIAFQESEEIFVINADGSNRVNLTNNGDFDAEPSWSPDGSRIMSISGRNPYIWITIHTMNTDGSNVRALPSDRDYWDMAPEWSPTGDRIVFVVRSDWYLPMTFTANNDGTNRQPFDGNGSGSEHRNKPKWSPDGTKMVFHIWEYFSGDTQIYVKNLNGSGVAQLTYAGKNFHPSWQLRVSKIGSVVVAEE